MNRRAGLAALAMLALTLALGPASTGVLLADAPESDRLSTNTFDASPNAEGVMLTAALGARFQQLGTWQSPEELVADREAIPPLLSVNPNPGVGDTNVPRSDQHFWSTTQLAALAPAAALSRHDIVLRGGWWSVEQPGNPFKVNQFESTQSGPFWKADALLSDRRRTLDLNLTGSDDETTASHLYFFGSGLSGRVDYQRFLRRLDHDPLTNFSAPASGDEIVSEDLNVGDEYAIRVQDLRTHFKGHIGKRIKYRVNMWMLRKKGARQALATQHAVGSPSECRTCHVTGQTQRIDWLTTELEPVVETRIGPISLVYSRPMRMFSQNDQVVLAPFGDGHIYKWGGDFPYAVVPDNVTQIDRLRASVDVTRYTHLYANVYTGNTNNKLRDTDRRFHGYDLRLTNRPWDQLTLTAYTRMNRQRNELPPFLIDPEPRATTIRTSIIPPYGLRQPINYLRSASGGTATWRPFAAAASLWRNVRLNGGLEYGSLSRSDAVWYSQAPPDVFDQGRTTYLQYTAGATVKWSATADLFTRYRGRHTSNPLYAVDQYAGVTNTNRPEQEDLIEIGGTWFPISNLMASASLGIEKRQNHSNRADFVEDNFPMTFTLWYAPDPAWSLSGGYGYYTNWIDQDIYFPSDDPGSAALDRSRWNYGGRSEVLNLGLSHRQSDRLTLLGGLEYVWTRNSFNPLVAWPDLPAYSAAIVDKTRYTAGVDWAVNQRVSGYVRYVYQDYHDLAVPRISGTSHQFLIGLTGYH